MILPLNLSNPQQPSYLRHPVLMSRRYSQTPPDPPIQGRTEDRGQTDRRTEETVFSDGRTQDSVPSDERTLYVTSCNGAAATTSTSCPPDLQEQEEEVEADLDSEACLEILQEALDEAAGQPEPYKYQAEPGGSQVREWRTGGS